MASAIPTCLDNPLTEEELRTHHGYVAPKKKSLNPLLRCNKFSFTKAVVNFFPILSWLKSYQLKKYIIGDVLAGLTVAVVRIPQCMAYGLLAGLDPINGLYTGFFAPLTYSIFGTSRHISVGTFAVISLMLGAALDKAKVNSNSFQCYKALGIQSTNSTETYPITLTDTVPSIDSTTSYVVDSGIPQESLAEDLVFIVSLTVLIGLILIALGIFQFGFISLFLSAPLVSAFTTGAALYVLTSQLKHCFGIKLQRRSGVFGLINTYAELFSKLGETHVPTVVITLICLLILIPIKHVNRKYKDKLKSIPIPVELFVVVLGTVVSYAANLEEVYGVNVVGPIPRGMPGPLLPKPSLWISMIGDASSIAVVIFAVSISLGKMFSKKHGYNINPNQELFALGLCQITSGLFRGHANGGALARSTVQESSGGNTQLASLISSVVLLFVLLVIGPLFKPLPITCLSCIILVNLHGLLMQFERLPQLWRLDKYDFAVWMMTFIGVVLLGLDLGLIAGVATSLIAGVLRTYKPTVEILGKLPGTDVYRNIKLFDCAVETPRIKVIRFPQSPSYANNSVLQTLPVYISSNSNCNISGNETSEILNEGENLNLNNIPLSPLQTKFVVLDCSSWCSIDTVGMCTIKEVLEELANSKILIYMASVTDAVYAKLSLVDIFTGEVPLAKVYPTVHHAVAAAEKTFDVQMISSDSQVIIDNILNH